MIASRIQSTIILSAILLIEFHAEAFSIISMSLQQKEPFRPSNMSSNPYGDASSTSTSTSTTNSPPSTDIDIDIDINNEKISNNNSCSSLYFQLEEREDKDTCTTELFLKKDGTVAVFDSDGPPPISATGTWGQSTDQKFFIMNIKRKFGTGSDGRDMGEFCFEVERSYEGTIMTVGEKTLAVEGVMHLVDELMGDLKVGFFSMIDTTAAKFGEDEGDNKDELKGGMSLTT